MVDPVPAGYHTVTPYLIASDAAQVIEFAKQAFAAEEHSCVRGADGQIMHAEVRIGDSAVMLAQACDQWPAMPTCLYLYVPDVDDVYARAVAAGGKPVRELTNTFYGDRCGGVVDPAGNQWWVATRIEDVSSEELERRHAEKMQ